MEEICELGRREGESVDRLGILAEVFNAQIGEARSSIAPAVETSAARSDGSILDGKYELAVLIESQRGPDAFDCDEGVHFGLEGEVVFGKYRVLASDDLDQ